MFKTVYKTTVFLSNKSLIRTHSIFKLQQFSFSLSSQSINSKLLYEREIRSTLSKLDRVVYHIPEGPQRVKTIEDLKRLSEQFRDLIFGDETITSEEEMVKSEKDMKKLLTVTKSKFYMLRVNFPKAFETIVDREINQGEEYDPLAEKKPLA